MRLFLLEKAFQRFQKFYPYDSPIATAKARTILRIMLLKFFNRILYPNISLVKYMKDLKCLKNDQEFLKHYYTSKKGFKELWLSKPRKTKDQVESFYREHDKDVWRQVYLSKYDRSKKNRILRVTDVIRDYSRNPNIKILDYGCGCGHFSHYLYKKGYRNITLADIESSSLRFAKTVFGRMFKYIKINNPRPLKETYDAILLLDVLGHVFYPFDVAKHVLDHLKKGGILVLNYEREAGLMHLHRAIKQREKVMNYIYKKCRCLKREEVFIKI